MIKNRESLILIFILILSFVTSLICGYSLKALKGDGIVWSVRIMDSLFFHHDYPSTRLITYLSQIIPVAIINIDSTIIPLVMTRLFSICTALVFFIPVLYSLCRFRRTRDNFYLLYLLFHFLLIVGTDSYLSGVTNLTSILIWFIYDLLRKDVSKWSLFFITISMFILIFSYELVLICIPFLIYHIYKNQSLNNSTKVLLYSLGLVIIFYNLYQLYVFSNINNDHTGGFWLSLRVFKSLLFFLIFSLSSLGLILNSIKDRGVRLFSVIYVLTVFGFLIFYRSGDFERALYELSLHGSYDMRIMIIAFALVMIGFYHIFKTHIKVEYVALCAILMSISSISSSQMYSKDIRIFKNTLDHNQGCNIIDNNNPLMKLQLAWDSWSFNYMSLALSSTRHIDTLIVDKDWVESKCSDNFHILKYPSYKYFSFSKSLVEPLR